MKLKIMNTAICRTPAFTTDVRIEDVWENLKLKIKESSPTFYQIIKDEEIEDIQAIKKIWFTVWKYFKRAKYRATPFGSFSAISLVSVTNTQPRKITISSMMLVHDFKDWKEIDGTLADHNTSMLDYFTLLYKNSSVYFINDEIRYIRSKDGKFEITIVASIPQLRLILELCEEYQSVSNITNVMQVRFSMAKDETLDLLHQMLHLQLIISNKYPNIIGQDYFERINCIESATEATYRLSERKLFNNELSSQSLHNIPHLIDFLVKNLPDVPINDLEDFKFGFKKKFENREVPLSIVMDPEIGIGYGKLEQQLTDHLVNILRQSEKEIENTMEITYSPFHVFLLNNILPGKAINLQEFEGNKMEKTQVLPNTFSVLLHFWNGVPVIENIGGSTANSLLGRFTMISEEFEKKAHNITDIEEKANPDIMFFDIAYQAEKKVDNVNRRKLIYKQELPILTWSCSKHPLDFSDIMVSVKENKIILRSKKHNKRLIPRIPSAYNYTRSDLSVYRFLCDIQNQNLKTSLNFSLCDYFPNLQKYPRATYRDIVISPAMWLVPNQFLNYKNAEIDGYKTDDLRRWLKIEGIDFIFKAGNGDHTLYFDPASAEDLQAFLMYCKQQLNKKIYISEALISKQGNVIDESGQNYAAQFVVNYYHEERIYKPVFNDKIPKKSMYQKNEIYLPGTEWLYYELYCYPNRSNKLLLNHIKKFLAQIKHCIHKWFFVRYDYPSPHLRLRLHLKKPELCYLITSKLNTQIESRINSGQISDFCIKTYKPEIERFGADRISHVEKFFHIDSEYALAVIAKTTNTEHLYMTSIYAIKNIFIQHFDTIDEQITFVETMANGFSNEINMNPEKFREINKAFNKVRGNIDKLIVYFSARIANQYKTTISLVLFNTSETEKGILIADMIHMHINRLFPTDQRLHETIIYHYLLRQLMINRARLS